VARHRWCFLPTRDLRPSSSGPSSLERFAALLDRAEKLRPAALALDELRELGRLYRFHSAALARLKSDGEDPEAVRSANALVVRAYTLLYSTPPARQPLSLIVRERLPAALGRSWRVLALAWLLLAAGMVVGLALGLRDPEAIPTLMPGGLGYGELDLEHLAESREARERFFARQETASAVNALFGSALFAHNTRVGLLAFATGILAGIPTVLLQLMNGLMLGAFAAIFVRDPWPVEFLAWILPHGVPELTAIALCTAGGLALGRAVVAPGRQSRARALRAALDSALVLLGIAVVLFLVAAAMESFVRESALSTAARLSIAAAEVVIIALGTARIHRLARREVDTSWVHSLTPRGRTAPPGSGSAPAP
jgi:uncharacterized membrane protein SpoIIM required for sporulation